MKNSKEFYILLYSSGSNIITIINIKSYLIIVIIKTLMIIFIRIIISTIGKRLTKMGSCPDYHTMV